MTNLVEEQLQSLHGDAIDITGSGDIHSDAIPSTSSSPLKTMATKSDDMEVSISNTITSLQTTLQKLDASRDYTIFISEEVVSRPPFLYFYGLVQFIDKIKPSLGWKKLLLNDEQRVPQTRKEKVR